MFLNKRPMRQCIVLLFIAATTTQIYTLFFDGSAENKMSRSEKHLVPYDYLFLQRSYPDQTFDMEAYWGAMYQASQQSNLQRSSSSVSWDTEGPGNIGGRVNCIAIHPTNSSIMYEGNTTGGIFKTTDAGATWNPIFDNNPALAIGCIVLDPNNSSTIYAGTGDPNVSGYPFIGDGVYKSTDAGATWTNIGLQNTRIISDFAVDPTNSNVLYAATMGTPFVRDNNRGLYKSTDGGTTWNQVLFINNETGISDLVLDPVNPQVIYATSWTRIRNNQESLISGNDCRIYKSTDGGATWNIMTNGLPNQPLSRIGLTMYPQDHNRLYAVIVDVTLELQGIYQTTNAGSSWTAVPQNGLDPGCLGGFGWYFGKIAVNPNDPNDIFILGVDLWRTQDGGQSWNYAAPEWWFYDVHADKHDLEFAPNGDILLCTDGGIYRTTDNCATWQDIEKIPNTQFYRVAANPNDPSTYYGGAQDNGTTGGNSATINQWPRIYGGDGFQPVFVPSDPQTFYAETQNGNIVYTDDGGFNFNSGTSGIDMNDRKHWDMPYIMDPSNSGTLYTGTYRMYKMTGAPYGTWQPASNDLTDGIVFDPRFHTISAIGTSAANSQYVYSGTTDGNVWSSLNGGTSWNNISAGLPDRYVTSVQGSPNIASNVYVTHSGYKSNEYIPHVHMSVNNGASWADISGDLPQFAVNDIVVLPGNENVLFVATDAGVYVTTNGGTNWTRVGNNMPIIPVYDIALGANGNRLIAGTFARSIMTIDIAAVITGINENALSATISCFPNPATDHVVISTPAGELVVVYDLNGAVVQEFRAQESSTKINVANYRSGVYVVTINDGKSRKTTRFIKN